MRNDSVNDRDFEATIVGAESDGTEGYVLLDEGFAVATIDKVYKTYKGDDRKPVVELSLICEQNGKTDKVFDNLFVIPSCEWKLRQFFKALGLLETGQAFAYRWNLEGMRVPVTLAVEDYTNRDGEQRQKNVIKNYRVVKATNGATHAHEVNLDPQPPDACPLHEDDIPF